MNNKGKIAITVLIMLVLVASAFVVFLSKKTAAAQSGRKFYCGESDGGINPEQEGSVLAETWIDGGSESQVTYYNDACIDSTHLNEGYCDENKQGHYIAIDCVAQFGNEGGACGTGFEFDRCYMPGVPD